MSELLHPLHVVNDYYCDDYDYDYDYRQHSECHILSFIRVSLTFEVFFKARWQMVITKLVSVIESCAIFVLIREAIDVTVWLLSAVQYFSWIRDVLHIDCFTVSRL